MGRLGEERIGEDRLGSFLERVSEVGTNRVVLMERVVAEIDLLLYENNYQITSQEHNMSTITKSTNNFTVMNDHTRTMNVENPENNIDILNDGID